MARIPKFGIANPNFSYKIGNKNPKFMYIERTASAFIQKYIGKRKAIILYGPRRSGKTTLLSQLFPEQPDTLSLSCEEERVRQRLVPDRPTLAELIGGRKKLILDEAQHLEQTGLVLKIIIDAFPDLTVVASGSSSFDLANKVEEPLTGRHLTYTLFPFTLPELMRHFPSTEHDHLLDHAFMFGTYPELFALKGKEEKIRALTALTDAYLYKDILGFGLVKSSRKLRELLEILALQIGNEVSYSELGAQIGADNKTVERYIDLLEKSFVLFRLNCYSRNQRSAIRKKVKVYFVDLGIRNAVLNAFTSLNLRSDKGAILENLFISEYWKQNRNAAQRENMFFWRTYDQKELDLIAEKNGIFRVFEVKWSEGKTARHFPAFRRLAPKSTLTMVNAGNICGILSRLTDIM